MKNKSLFFVLLLSLSFAFRGMAQDEGYTPPPRPVHNDVPKPDILERLYFGGNIGLQIGQGGYFAGIAPLAGYRITEKFSAGISLSYFRYDIATPYGQYQNNIYGGSVFARYFVLPNVFIHVEPKVLNGYWADGERSNLYPVLAGVGYRGKMAGRMSFYAMVLYDLNYSVLSPEASPISYTFGVGLGF